MEFGIEKWSSSLWKVEKKKAEGRVLPNRESIGTLEENENYNYRVILDEDIIKQSEMNEKIKKEYLRITTELLETKLCSKNLFKWLNTWEVSLVRYIGPFLKRTSEIIYTKYMSQEKKRKTTHQNWGIHKSINTRSRK